MEMGLTWHEDPRIREQDCEALLSFLLVLFVVILLRDCLNLLHFCYRLSVGNYQDPQVIKKAKSERHKFGSFYYRFPHGESGSDVVSEPFFSWLCSCAL